ncbi:hypothetical protein LTR66_010255, partial [Elasticomyces elasticus]
QPQHQHAQQPQQSQQQHQQAPPAQSIAPQAPMMPGGGPYFIDPGPVPALPQPINNVFDMRPPIYRSQYTNSYEFMPPVAPMMSDTDPALQYNYPSPGLSNGLDTLALAAGEHYRRRTPSSDSS